MAETSFQFQCPSCNAVLQASLQRELTSVQCGECYDVFDVQHPGSVNAAAPAVNGEAGANAAAGAPGGGHPTDGGADGQRKQQRSNGAADVHSASNPPTVDEEATAKNLEASLSSCTAHRERIEQMLADEPNNKNLLDLRDQLTNAIQQLQGTKEMVDRTKASRGRPMLNNMGGAFAAGTVEKGPSCRKNKAQRCSVCGGIGHKSRTCSVVQQQQQLQQAQQQAAATAATNLHLQQVQPAGMPMQVPMFATGCALPPGAYPSMCAMAPAAQPGLAAQPVASVPPAAVAAPPTAVAPPPAAVAAPPPPAESAAPPEEPKIEQPAVPEPQAAS